MKEKRNIKKESEENEGINPEEEESSLRASVASRKCKSAGFWSRSIVRTYILFRRFYFTCA